MYSKTQNRLKLQFFPSQLSNKKSKWYQLETLMPWSEISKIYQVFFQIEEEMPFLLDIIQSDKGLSDRRTLITIMETPMLQYFLGFDDFIHDEIFDYTLLCKYRQLLDLILQNN